MQQGSDFSSSYYPHQYAPAPHPNPYPNPSPAEFLPSNPIQPPAFPSAPASASASASAPPYSHYSAAAAAGFPASAPYPSYAQTSVDLTPNLPPSAPSYTPPQPQLPQSQPQHQSQSQFPSYQPYNASPFPPEPSPTAPYPHLQQSYYPHDSNQPPAAPTPNYASLLNPNPSQSLLHSTFSSSYPSYDNSYDSAVARFDHGGGSGYFNESSSNHSLNISSAYPDAGFRYDRLGSQDDGLGDGVFRYDGGRVEPYGARGTGSSTKSSLSAFDDYGRSTSFSGKEQMGSMGKIVRAVPKADAQQDVKNGVQKFRVKLLPEGGGQSTMDVLCQIGLDGIRMLDPSTNRTLRIYPLETVTRWEVTDTSIYTFWSKSSVDIEPRRIRLQSNSYTTSTILDTVTAATVQLKEMGGKDSLGKSNGTDAGKLSDQPSEKKKGFGDWMNLMKPGNEEKDHWVPDEAVSKCTSCGTDFGAFVRKHHCRNCGDIFCDKCTHGRIALTADEHAQPVRVCDRCMAEVSQRLSNAKETANKSAGPHTHEDLARKLQEEMEKNKPSSGSKSSGGSGRRMREVACPTCTVHLQVQVPSSGSETIECGVCQHPFLVSAH